jgi:NAD(P)H-nitrite reductase large subunit
VVAAIGVAPRLDLVEGTPIRTGRGIVVNERCETSVEGIFAAGDVAQGTDALTGASRPIPIFPHAYGQGFTAGTCMAGGEPRPGPLFAMNAVEVFGLPTISVGLAAAPAEGLEILTQEDERRSVYRRVVLRGNHVVGALFVGDVDRAGIYTGLIRDRVDVGGIKRLLLTDEFGLLRLPAQYRKHLVKGEGIEV